MKVRAILPKLLGRANRATGQKALYYEGEPEIKADPTRVFAYYATPVKRDRQMAPVMVLVHGGGGAAFPAVGWARAKRGYAAIAMDLGGCGPGPSGSTTADRRKAMKRNSKGRRPA